MRCRVKPFGIAGLPLLQTRNKVKDGANVTNHQHKHAEEERP